LAGVSADAGVPRQKDGQREGEECRSSHSGCLSELLLCGEKGPGPGMRRGPSRSAISEIVGNDVIPPRLSAARIPRMMARETAVRRGVPQVAQRLRLGRSEEPGRIREGRFLRVAKQKMVSPRTWCAPAGPPGQPVVGHLSNLLSLCLGKVASSPRLRSWCFDRHPLRNGGGSFHRALPQWAELAVHFEASSQNRPRSRIDR